MHRLGRITTIAVLGILMASCAPRRYEPEQIPPSYRDAPVLFQMFQPDFGDTANLRLMPRGKLTLPPIGVESVTGFDWKTHDRTDLSWWIRVERMDYLLPLMESNEEQHEDVVHAWIRGWLDAHEKQMKPNKGSHDAMGIGIRGCVLVRYLAEVYRDDPYVASRLKKCILWTQEYLRNDVHFNLVSNHAIWEAMGLFETTRVFPDTTVTRIALNRLFRTATASASTMGTHLEHSTRYHFYFLEWLKGFVDYLISLDLPGYPELARLVEIEKRMEIATYFLYDHQFNEPQIGDTDARRFREPPYPVAERDRSTVWFDEDAGYAIYKDDERSAARRYVVFCIQNQPPRMRFHYHNDRLAVYYSYDGEIIFSDQGRYSYSSSAMRSYVKSASAHNTIFEKTSLMRRGSHLQLVRDPLCIETDEQTLFGATLQSLDGDRHVVIPADRPDLCVYDRIREQTSTLALWHIGPDVASFQLLSETSMDTSRVYRWHLQTKNNREFELEVTVTGENLDLPSELSVVEGEKDPLMGWHSASYNTAVPVPVIKLQLYPKNEILVSTEISPVE